MQTKDRYASRVWIGNKEVPKVVLDSGPDHTLWVYSQDCGPMMIIQAGSYESALEAVYDELPCVPEDEIHEAYGFASIAEMGAAIEAGEEPDLMEGYHHQANAGDGTGIVSPGYYEGVTELERFEGVRVLWEGGIEEDSRATADDLAALPIGLYEDACTDWSRPSVLLIEHTGQGIFFQALLEPDGFVTRLLQTLTAKDLITEEQ